jgi:hypothetical protein
MECNFATCPHIKDLEEEVRIHKQKHACCKAWADDARRERDALRKALDEAEYELAQFGAFAGHIERWERDIHTANTSLHRTEPAAGSGTVRGLVGGSSR